MTHHTPEPWTINKATAEYMGAWGIESRALGKFFEIAKINIWLTNSKDNVERIVQCVNACAGIENPMSLNDKIKQLEESKKLLEDENNNLKTILKKSKCSNLKCEKGLIPYITTNEDDQPITLHEFCPDCQEKAKLLKEDK